MSKNNNLKDFVTDLANTIRTKKGYSSSKLINPQDFSAEIASINGGGEVLLRQAAAIWKTAMSLGYSHPKNSARYL